MMAELGHARLVLCGVLARNRSIYELTSRFGMGEINMVGETSEPQ